MSFLNISLRFLLFYLSYCILTNLTLLLRATRLIAIYKTIHFKISLDSFAVHTIVCMRYIKIWDASLSSSESMFSPPLLELFIPFVSCTFCLQLSGSFWACAERHWLASRADCVPWGCQTKLKRGILFWFLLIF